MNNVQDHIEKYIGKHVYSDDFAFQEQMRTSDLTIKSTVKDLLGNSKADPFFINGWGQVISAAYILEKNPSQLKITETFAKSLVEELEKAVSKGSSESNPFVALNVRGFTKSIMMYPHSGKYFDFQKVNIDKPITYLNRFIKEAELKFALHEGKFYLKIHPEDESNIFNKLWNTNFSQLLKENGYTDMEKNKECPHITLINSDVIGKIREQFNLKYGKTEGAQKSDYFFENLVNLINKELKEQENPIQFTEFGSSYSEDYTPFEEVIVAKLEAPYVGKALKILVEEVEKELGIQIPVQPRSSFHLTIATKYRKPNPSLTEDMQSILNGTGKYATTLNSYWQQLVKA